MIFPAAGPLLLAVFLLLLVVLAFVVDVRILDYVSIPLWEMPVEHVVPPRQATVVVHSLATIVPGVGIAVPMFIPPVAAVAVSLALAFRRAPPVAYVSGSMGALIGADLSNLHRLGELGVPVVSIGGAGTGR
jgi:hypothetical protein